MINERTAMTHWAPQPLPARLGGVWRSKVAYQQETRERAAAQKRQRYAANREAERAKARERYHKDPACLARKLRCNMTLQQRVRAAKADRRKYLKHRAKALAYQRERALGRFIGRRLLAEINAR